MANSSGIGTAIASNSKQAPDGEMLWTMQSIGVIWPGTLILALPWALMRNSTRLSDIEAASACNQIASQTYQQKIADC
jgi:hypothetical protein